MNTQTTEVKTTNKFNAALNTAFKGIGLAMGVATLVLLILNEIETSSALTLLSMGVASLGISLFTNKKCDK